MYKFYNMSFLNFIDTGFIFTLGLILVVSGAIMLYCYRRLNILENSVIEHGKILHNFIANYHQSRQNQSNREMLNTIHENIEDDEDTNDENIKHVITNYKNNDKIVVSDDDDSEEVSDEESDELSEYENDENDEKTLIETLGEDLDTFEGRNRKL